MFQVENPWGCATFSHGGNNIKAAAAALLTIFCWEYDFNKC